MNRTNSLEPAYTQPLHTSYHQLLQSKTKIEDELYQTQRQLRRKEGEYLKKIAVYEQRIDQLEEQLEEFRTREESTKAMYDKILAALNSYDKASSYSLDMERIQEMFAELFKSHRSSPQRGNDSFSQSNRKANVKELQLQVESLEQSLAQANECCSKARTMTEAREKECQDLRSRVEILERVSEAAKKEIKSNKDAFQQTSHDFTTLSFDPQEKDQMQAMISALQSQLKHLQSSPPAYDQQVQTSKLASLTSENERLFLSLSSHKQDLAALKESNAKLAKEIESFKSQIKDQDQLIAKYRKQQPSGKESEKVKSLQIRIGELEKMIGTKQEEITRLNQKLANIKVSAQTSKYDLPKQQEQPKPTAVRNFTLGSKDQQVTVEVQRNEKTQNKKAGNFKVSNRQSAKSKMFQATISINNETGKESQVTANPIEQITAQNPFVKKSSRNSNVMAHSSMKDVVTSQNAESIPRAEEKLDDKGNADKSQERGASLKKSSHVQHRPLLQQCFNNEQVKQQTSSVESLFTRSLNKKIEARRKNQMHRIFSQDHLRESSLQKSGAPFTDGDNALLSQEDLEQVFKRMIDRIGAGDQSNLGTSLREQSPIIPKKYYESHTAHSNRKRSQQPETNYMIGSRYPSCQKNSFTIDKEFLTKLEVSLKKLTKSNERIKQIMREKEEFEKQCIKLKQKIKLLKDEKQAWLIERESLVSQNNKMEFKLKQAQVILNIEGDNGSYGQMFRGSAHHGSYKHIPKMQYMQRDVSPSTKSNLTLNIIQDHSQDKYHQVPLTCRVNDSYDISLRMNPDSSYACHGTMRRPMFHNTLEKSSLDQSLLNLKQSQANDNVQVSQFSMTPMAAQTPQQFVSQNEMNKSQTRQYCRGKTPTLHINLQQSPDAYCIGISTNRGDPQRESKNNGVSMFIERQQDHQAMNHSKNFSRSTTNLLPRKNSYQTQQVSSSRQFHKYQSNRDTVLMKSPPQQPKFQNLSNISAFVPRNENHANTSAILAGSHTPQDTDYRKMSQPFSNLNNSQHLKQQQSQSILRKMTTGKAKDRYYTSGCSGSITPNNDFSNQAVYYQKNLQRPNNQGSNQAVTFDDEEEYTVNQIDEEQTFDDENLMNNINDDSRGFGTQAFKGDNYEDTDDPEADDNAGAMREERQLDNSPMTIKVVQLPPKSKLSFNKQKRLSKKEEGQAPSDERENEEKVQYKHLKSFGPASHSRYVNDDSQ